MTEPTVHHWTASDGVDLAYREIGDGRPLLLVHGLFSDSFVNWVKFGHAAKLAAAGRRVIMPDHRAHGLSGKPHDPARYPTGILGRDLAELIGTLRLTEYDLAGFSLGSRIVVQCVGEGHRPGRAVLAGAGLDGMLRWGSRRDFFLKAIELFDSASHGDPHWIAIQFMKTMKIDLAAAAPLLRSFEAPPAGWADAFSMPTLVLCGDQDHDNGFGSELAEALPNAMFVEVPGIHMSSVTRPEFGDALVRFLG